MKAPAHNRVSLTEAARISGVSTRTLRRYIASGGLAAYRIGPRLIKVEIAEVEALFKPLGAA